MANKSKTTKPNKPATSVVTSFTMTIVRVLLGSFFTIFSLLALITCALSAQPVFRLIAASVWGIFGCFNMPFILISFWFGILCLVSAYHPVSWRGFILMTFTLLFSAALYDLMNAGTVFAAAKDASNGYSQLLNSAFSFGTRGIGTGFVGMLLAYPLYAFLGGGTVIGIIISLTAVIVLLFLFFRTNPLRLFNVISDALEAHRQKRIETQPQRDAARQQRELEKQRREEEKEQKARQHRMAQAAAATPTRNGGAQVPSSRSAYEPAAYPDEVPAAQMSFDDVTPTDPDAAPLPIQDDDYWPYQPYTEPNPYAATAQPAYPAFDQPQRSAPMQHPYEASSHSRQNTYVSAPEAKQSVQKTASSRRVDTASETVVPSRTSRAVANTFTAQTTATQEPEYIYDVPEENVTPVPEDPVYEPAPAEKPVYQQAPIENKPVLKPVNKQATAPEKAQPVPAQSSVFEAPAAEDEEEEKFSDADWAQLVRRQRDRNERSFLAIEDKPKPVGVDPAVPLTGERISITPRETLRTGDPAKRGMDGHEHQAAGLQISMDIPADYVPPSYELLTRPSNSLADTTLEDQHRAEIIVNTLNSFKIPSEVKQVMHGPAITRFAIQIGAGIRVTQVTSVLENIGLELGTKQVRVEAPIQGTNYIGIEAPNKKTTPVTFREVLESDELRASSNPMLVALGKDIAGTPILCDLSKMPHLLIAGQTGSGKSVCINSIICSLIYRASPRKVRLIMVDPKQVELQVYNAIPHLLVPVVSDPKKASGVLNWVVNEMLERYSKFSAINVRNLAGYNKHNEGTDRELPNIVVIIDEMADLMDTCRKDVEESIRRLAALARAAGIYMVLATQRPSVDVITGVIKNNIPSRIAFAVSSATDSRTIIDLGGAEKLLGRGDMLYKPTGSAPTRVQGCFLKDEEVVAICEDIGKRYHTNYNQDIQDQLNAIHNEPDADTVDGDDTEFHAGDSSSLDDLLQEAILMAIEDGQTSTSMLQRRLRVGYARAGRLIDEMEKRDIISKSEGSKPRKTLMTREQYAKLLEDQTE